jgi:hypothetical protein
MKIFFLIKLATTLHIKQLFAANKIKYTAEPIDGSGFYASPTSKGTQKSTKQGYV